MKNASRMLLFRYITIAFLLGVVSMVPQLLILSGYINHLRLAKLLTSNYTISLFLIIPFSFSIIGFLIARSKINKLNLNKQLQHSEDEIQVLQLELSDYQYALELCAITAIIDDIGQIKKVNKNFIRFTGYKEKELLGQSIWKLPSSLKNPGVFVDIKQAMNCGNVWNGELEYYQPDGTIAYTKTTVVPLLQKDNEQNDCMVIQFDITQEKNSEIALRKSENEKRIILENTQTLICTQDQNGVIININKAGADILGKIPEEIIGSPIQHFLVENNPLCGYLDSIKESSFSEGYLKVKTSLNKTKTLLYKNVTTTEAGKIYIITSAIDITDTIEAQKTLDNHKTFTSRLVDESSNMICVIDQEKNITFLNKKLKSFFNIKQNDKIEHVTEAQSRIPEFASFTGDMEDTSKNSVHECKIEERNTGIIKWFKVQKTFFTDNDNKKYILIIATDISEKHAIQIELIKARQAIETSLRMRENFIANMSHEIRTPLNAIIGFSELLNDTLLDVKQEDYIKTIKVAGQNLLNIINDILDLSKLESGNMQIVKARMDIGEVVNNVKKLFEPRIKEKGISLTVDIGSNIPQILMGDEIKLNQILINLVSNAIKFTNKGKVEIEVKTEGFRSNQGKIIFLIKDSGIGIEKDKLDVIFQRYSQASKDIHKLYGGTGLGLSICKNLIELLGGEIKLSSEKGIGTTFSFSLPFETSDHLNEEKAGLRIIERKYETPLRILIAEDNNTNAKLALQVLRKQGHDATHVKDGLEVLEILEKNDFDIILMDVEMAEMDGIEATKIIRLSGKKFSNIPIIALTAHSFKGERHICDEAGMNAYLGKPYRPKELLDCISTTWTGYKKNANKIRLQDVS